MKCDNRGCPYKAEVTVMLPTGETKRICGHCFQVEGWDRKREPRIVEPKGLAKYYGPARRHSKAGRER